MHDAQQPPGRCLASISLAVHGMVAKAGVRHRVQESRQPNEQDRGEWERPGLEHGPEILVARSSYYFIWTLRDGEGVEPVVGWSKTTHA